MSIIKIASLWYEIFVVLSRTQTGASKPRENDASCAMDILGGGRKNSVTFYTVLWIP